MNQTETIFYTVMSVLCKAPHLNRPGQTPRELISQYELTPKQCWRYLEKYTKRGWYEYGVTLDLGWITDKWPAPKPLVNGE